MHVMHCYAIQSLQSLGGYLIKTLNLLKECKVLIQSQKATFENQHFETNTFQKPVSGQQKCRNLHDVGRSTGIRQAFRSSFFTNYDIM